MKKNPEDRFLRDLLRGIPAGRDLVVGPGDDCAVVRVPGASEVLLLKTDCIVEDVHFLRSHDPARVGWKALARTISDVAAMGGRPGQALITLFTPSDLPAGYWKKFYSGLNRAATRFEVGIAGGEISRSPGGIAVSVALTGHVAARHLVLRSGGKPGHRLFVTGRLGGSIAGHHLDFVPRVAEARWLVENFRPSAMMDLSDGLGSDLPRLASASKCGFAIDPAQLPIRPGCTRDQALTDGEDYELLFACVPSKERVLRRNWAVMFPDTPLTMIGELNDTFRSPRNWPGGWDHFG